MLNHCMGGSQASEESLFRTLVFPFTTSISELKCIIKSNSSISTGHLIRIAKAFVPRRRNVVPCLSQPAPHLQASAPIIPHVNP
jgi:hypothetical protein